MSEKIGRVEWCLAVACIVVAGACLYTIYSPDVFPDGSEMALRGSPWAWLW
jgi:hypothetical protein